MVFSSLPKHVFQVIHRDKPTAPAPKQILDAALLPASDVYGHFESRIEGLTSAEAAARLAEYGPNVLKTDRPPGLWALAYSAIVNPLVILLIVLAATSLMTNDLPSAVIMGVMIGLGVGIRLWQESQASVAVERLRSMISITATVVRDGEPREMPVSQLVRGDVINLAAGDMVPADVRIVSAKDLFVIQGSLTGESFPVEKNDAEQNPEHTSPLELTSIAYLGTSVDSGSATAVVAVTGTETYLGSIAESISEKPPDTAFDKGIAQFTWMMLRFVAVMVPGVFVINGVTKGNWTEAFFFATAVAVGLTPAMLPMIVTVCLSHGALAMSRKKIIIKRINAIQNLGAMDVLCTDKTGTLTMDQVILERYCDVDLKEDNNILTLAYLNSHFQTGLKSLLDRAVLAHVSTHEHAGIPEYAKVDEIPFDFRRRIMSVVVRTPTNLDRLISKGAPEAVFSRCSSFERNGVLLPLTPSAAAELRERHEKLSRDGFRILAIASKDIPPRGTVEGDSTPYSKADESDLVLKGYIAFLDPPKDSAAKAISSLRTLGVSVKVLTGDNDLSARKTCIDVGLGVDSALLGSAIDAMSDEELALAVTTTTLFARVSPANKQRIIVALQSRKHIVGFMGDGINDAPALRAADVGISVDTAVDIAKESADIILLEKSLLVLEDAVLEGRKVFVNILKYIRMGASSNFGNMFSVVGASLIVPYLPMAPLQILANNLLYDVSQSAIPSDNVDPEQIRSPQPWDISQLARFILFIGPCSSIFDFTTFWLMLSLFDCWDVSTPAIAAHSKSLFQTGWFVESLVTQTLIIHVIRTNRLPFIQSCSSWLLGVTTLGIVTLGVLLPMTFVGRYLGFVVLPVLYWPIVAITAVCYLALTLSIKAWMLQRRWI